MQYAPTRGVSSATIRRYTGRGLRGEPAAAGVVRLVLSTLGLLVFFAAALFVTLFHSLALAVDGFLGTVDVGLAVTGTVLGDLVFALGVAQVLAKSLALSFQAMDLV